MSHSKLQHSPDRTFVSFIFPTEFKPGLYAFPRHCTVCVCVWLCLCGCMSQSALQKTSRCVCTFISAMSLSVRGTFKRLNLQFPQGVEINSRQVYLIAGKPAANTHTKTRHRQLLKIPQHNMFRKAPQIQKHKRSLEHGLNTPFVLIVCDS